MDAVRERWVEMAVGFAANKPDYLIEHIRARLAERCAEAEKRKEAERSEKTGVVIDVSTPEGRANLRSIAVRAMDCGDWNSSAGLVEGGCDLEVAAFIGMVSPGLVVALLDAVESQGH